MLQCVGKKSKSAGNKLCLVLFTFDFAAFALLWVQKLPEQTRQVTQDPQRLHA
jgi:hypothetical protein